MIRARAIIFSLILAFAAAGIVDDVEDCGSIATLLKIEVTNCTTQPCILIKGNTYDVVIDFIAANPTTFLNLEVKASMTIIEIPIINPEDGNGCEGLTTGCPVAGNVFQRHTTTITISGEYFERDAIVTFKLIDQFNQTQICLRADALIQASQP